MVSCESRDILITNIITLLTGNKNYVFFFLDCFFCCVNNEQVCLTNKHYHQYSKACSLTKITTSLSIIPYVKHTKEIYLNALNV